MKKIIWIDVGTHFAQEYESAFGSNFKLFWRLFRRLIARVIFLRGSFPELDLMRSVCSSRNFFKKNKSRFKFFFVKFIQVHNFTIISSTKNFSGIQQHLNC